MRKWCLHASSFIFDRIIIKVAGNQDRHKSSDELDFGPLISIAHLLFSWNKIWPWHTRLRWAIGTLWATCHQFITELWLWLMSKFCFSLILWKWIFTDMNFAFMLIFTRSRLGLLRTNSCEFITELWPLLNVSFVSAQYLEEKWINFYHNLLIFHHNLHIHWFQAFFG